jgi:hypothetical protein
MGVPGIRSSGVDLGFRSRSVVCRFDEEVLLASLFEASGDRLQC